MNRTATGQGPALAPLIERSVLKGAVTGPGRRRVRQVRDERSGHIRGITDPSHDRRPQPEQPAGVIRRRRMRSL